MERVASIKQPWRKKWPRIQIQSWPSNGKVHAVGIAGKGPVRICAIIWSCEARVWGCEEGHRRNCWQSSPNIGRSPPEVVRTWITQLAWKAWYQGWHCQRSSMAVWRSGEVGSTISLTFSTRRTQACTCFWKKLRRAEMSLSGTVLSRSGGPEQQRTKLPCGVRWKDWQVAWSKRLSCQLDLVMNLATSIGARLWNCWPRCRGGWRWCGAWSHDRTAHRQQVESVAGPAQCAGLVQDFGCVGSEACGGGSDLERENFQAVGTHVGCHNGGRKRHFARDCLLEGLEKWTFSNVHWEKGSPKVESLLLISFPKEEGNLARVASALGRNHRKLLDLWRTTLRKRMSKKDKGRPIILPTGVKVLGPMKWRTASRFPTWESESSTMSRLSAAWSQ